MLHCMDARAIRGWVVFSVYNRRGKLALVAVSNLTDTDREVAVRIDRAGLGLTGERIVVHGTVIRSPFSVSDFAADGTFTIDVDRRNFRLLVVQ